MKRIIPALVALLVISCGSSQKRPVEGEQAASQDAKYEQAVEYYTLTHGREGDSNALASAPRGKRGPTLDRQTAKRMLTLQQAMRDWKQETPDTRVPRADREAVEQVVQRVFQDPRSRSQMVVKTYDLKMCEKVSYQFYNGNRCLVNVMFYNRGPMIQAGVDLYLFRDKDQWQIVHRVDWIG